MPLCERVHIGYRRRVIGVGRICKRADRGVRCGVSDRAHVSRCASRVCGFCAYGVYGI